MITTSTATYEVRVLGCKANQYDAQQIRRILDLSGLTPVEEGAPSDVLIVHTCAVTASAISKSRQMIRKLVAVNPSAQVIVSGCGADQNLLTGIPEIRRRIPPRQGWMSELLQSLDDLSIPHHAPELPGNPDDMPVLTFAGHTRAFLKIQDGCDIGCTFCIVPRLRRKPRDKPLDLILYEAREMAKHGHKEIVVSGISVGLYGRDGGDASLPDVLRALIELPEIKRLRLSSLHPKELTDELLNVWASSPKMLPHIHLPLQAGSDNVLKAMNRNYTSKEFIEAVDRARVKLEDPAFNNDVIVGFPGETDKDFEATMDVCRRVGFSRMHVFPYSIRPGTRAERMTDYVDPATIKERSRRLRELGREMMVAFHQRYLGKETEVLAETWDPATRSYEGYTERYIPIRFAGNEGLTGEISKLRITEIWGDSTRGEICQA